MRILHYIEIENFKTFGDKQRIELDHPAVIIGPNNCGKTSVIQAIALWCQAVKTWTPRGRVPRRMRGRGLRSIASIYSTSRCSEHDSSGTRRRCGPGTRSEEHTSELQSLRHLV